MFSLETVLGVVDLFVVHLPFYSSFQMYILSLELGAFSGLITTVCSYILSERVYCAKVQWFEVCI